MKNDLKGAVLFLLVICLVLLSCSGKKEEGPSRKAGNGPKIINDSTVVPQSSLQYHLLNFRNNVTWSSNDSAWESVHKGLLLDAGSMIETGRRSMALLEGSLGDMVMMGERSKVKLTIKELSKYAPSGNLILRGLSLLNGSIALNIKKLAGGFIIETPSARLKVKGTNFTVSFNEKTKKTNLKVLEGTVAILDPKNSESPDILISRQEKVDGIGYGETPVRGMLSDKDIEEFITPDRMDSIRSDFWPSVTYYSPEEERENRDKMSSEIAFHRSNTSRVQSSDTVQAIKSTLSTSTDSSRVKTTNRMVQEKEKFEQQKQLARDSLENARKNASGSLDSTRKAFEKEKASTGSTSKSGDMFEEMKRKRNEQ
jgi:hypothetical protein